MHSDCNFGLRTTNQILSKKKKTRKENRMSREGGEMKLVWIEGVQEEEELNKGFYCCFGRVVVKIHVRQGKKR